MSVTTTEVTKKSTGAEIRLPVTVVGMLVSILIAAVGGVVAQVTFNRDTKAAVEAQAQVFDMALKEQIRTAQRMERRLDLEFQSRYTSADAARDQATLNSKLGAVQYQIQVIDDRTKKLEKSQDKP